MALFNPLDPFQEKRKSRQRAASNRKIAERNKLIKEENARSKTEFARRDVLSKTRNLLGLRGESALTTEGLSDIGSAPTDIEAIPQSGSQLAGTGGTNISAVRSLGGLLTGSALDTSEADARARSLGQKNQAEQVQKEMDRKKRGQLQSALGSGEDSRKRLLTSALG